MIEQNQIGENETRIKNATATLRKYEYTGGYSCKVCGNPFDANPPDDVHTFSCVYQCWKFDWIERIYQCQECNNTIILYWHPEVHKHHDHATLEEIKRKISKGNPGNSRILGWQISRTKQNRRNWTWRFELN